MKPYTLINIFNIDHGPVSECYIGQYRNKADAVMALSEIFKKRGVTPIDYDNKEIPIEDLFDELVHNGYAYVASDGSQRDLYFVRHEEVQAAFDSKKLPLDDVDHTK